MHKDRNVIGICTAELERPFHAKLVERVIKELTERGNYVLVFSSDSDLFGQTKSDEGDASIYDLPNYEIVDVMLIFSMSIRSSQYIMEIVHRAQDANIPVVSVDMEIPGCYNVVYNTEDAFERLVRHIVEYHNVKEINFMAGIEGDEISEQRLDIYKKVLDENDIPYEEDRVAYGNFWEGPTNVAMQKFIHPSKVPPEAIICSNDAMAIAVCDYLSEKNIKVPEEILVTGLDGIDEGKLHFPAITTAVRDEVNDAKKIAEMAHELALGRSVPQHLELGYHMQLSQSCGCQKHHLFDQGKLIRKLNTELALRTADIRRYADMEGVLLEKESLEDILDVVVDLLPENSFICINDDLEVGQGNHRHRHNDNPFTGKLKALVKIDGKASQCDCFRAKMIPELGKDMAQEKPVILLPLHYEAEVVGYLGIWQDSLSQINMISMLHFLRGLDHSLAYILSKFKF